MEVKEKLVELVHNARMNALWHNAQKTDEYITDMLMEDGVTVLPETGIGDMSDGYHTFNELYHHRAVLFSVICNLHPLCSWKAKKHHDGTMYDGMFIVGINTPEGQATYHYDIDPYWDMFKVPEADFAPEWDGHTADEAIRRIALLGTDGTDSNVPTKWISVKDRLPIEEAIAFEEEWDDYPEFLVMIDGGYLPTTLYYDFEENEWFGINTDLNRETYRVTHWQCLPRPPKGE